MAESRESSVTGEELLCNNDGNKNTTSSKQLLYSEYFNRTDTFEKAFLNTKKIPSFKDFPKSDVLSKVKQFMPVMAKAQSELEFKKPEEYSIEIELEENKPAIEIGLALFKDNADEVGTELNNPLDLLSTSHEDEAPDHEECSQAAKIFDIAKIGDDDDDLSSSSESDTENELSKNNCVQLNDDEDSDSSADDLPLPQRKRLCVDEVD